MSHQRTISNRLVGTYGVEDENTNSASAREAMEQLLDIPLSVAIATDAGATSNTANTKVWTNPFSYPVQLVSAVYNTDANVAADATNFATVDLLTDDGAGGTKVVGATIATNAAGFTLGVSRAFTLAPANCTIVSGGSLYRRAVKSGAGGVQLTVHTESVRMRRA